MKRIFIITGGQLDMEFAKRYMKTLSFDKVFAVDKGLEYADSLNIMPDYIIGDFDTVDKGIFAKFENMVREKECSAVIHRYSEKKDATDTELAVEMAMALQPEEIIIFGATGNRLDHTLMNMGLLVQIEKEGIAGQIVDVNNRIRLLDANIQTDRTRAETPYAVHMEVEQDAFLLSHQEKYLSIIPMSEEIQGLTLEGVMYPLKEHTVFQGSTLTVSNRITDGRAHVSLKKGRILIIEAYD